MILVRRRVVDDDVCVCRHCRIDLVHEYVSRFLVHNLFFFFLFMILNSSSSARCLNPTIPSHSLSPRDRINSGQELYPPSIVLEIHALNLTSDGNRVFIADTRILEQKRDPFLAESNLLFILGHLLSVMSLNLIRSRSLYPTSFLRFSPSSSFPRRSFVSTAIMAQKKEFLAIIPDKPGALQKRLEVRPYVSFPL